MKGDAYRLVITVTLALLVVLTSAGCARVTRPGGETADEVPESERYGRLYAMADRRDEPPALTLMSVSEVIGLPTFSKQYTRQQLTAISALEARGVTVTGFIARVFQARDGDFHVHLTQSPAGECLRRFTTDQLITEVTPRIRARKPGYTLEALAALCGSPIQVRVSSWLLYDWHHLGDPGRSTPWEIHPVTRIEVCCWRELGEPEGR